MKFHYSEDNRSKIYLSALKKLKREGLDPEYLKFKKNSMVSKELLED